MVLGAVATSTQRVPLMTYVTCPILGYHPAVVAQQAATVALLAGGGLPVSPTWHSYRWVAHATGVPALRRGGAVACPSRGVRQERRRPDRGALSATPPAVTDGGRCERSGQAAPDRSFPGSCAARWATPRACSPGRCCSPCRALSTSSAPVSSGIVHCATRSWRWACSTPTGSVLGLLGLPGFRGRGQLDLLAEHAAVPGGGQRRPGQHGLRDGGSPDAALTGDAPAVGRRGHRPRRAGGRRSRRR